MKEAPGYTCKRGSVTVEAAIVLPLLACLFAFLLYYFQIMQVQLYVQDALEHTGRKLAVYASVMESVEEDAVDTEYQILARTLFLAELQEKKKINHFVAGGMAGIRLGGSEYTANTISLKAVYTMRFPVRLLGKQSFVVTQQTKYRKWTGWNGLREDKEGELWVYVTEYGTVYHQTSDCTYLRLSIQSVNEAEIGSYRNESGGRYRLCSLCADTVNPFQKVYVTNYGDNYHRSLTCGGIKRTIEMRKLSEVEGLGACSKCWNWKKQ